MSSWPASAYRRASSAAHAPAIRDSVSGSAAPPCSTARTRTQYVDWRFRIGYDLTDDNLLYFLVATGNKAPSFNDTVDLDTGPGEDLFTPPVGPEKNTMFEIGSKNTFDVGDRPLLLNASAYYLEVHRPGVQHGGRHQLLDTDPSNDVGCTRQRSEHGSAATSR